MNDPRQTTGTPIPTPQQMAGGIPQNANPGKQRVAPEFSPPPVIPATADIPIAPPAQLMPQAPPIGAAAPPPMAAPIAPSGAAVPQQMANNPMMMQALMQRMQQTGGR